MKMTNQEIINFASAAFGNKKVPIKIAYAISKNAETVGAAFKAYEETRKKRLEEYAEKDEEGNPIIENGQYVVEDLAAWSEEIRELLEIETEVQVHKVSIDEFMKCDDSRFDVFSVSEMAILNFMIEE